MTDDAIRVSPRREQGPGRGSAAGPAGAARGGRRGGLPVTTELVVFATVALAVLIAAAVDEAFDAPHAWTLVTVLAAAYVLSRGLAKHEQPRDEPLD